MILLDTCVVSDSIKPDPSSAVIGWIRSLPEYRVYLPSVVVGELRRGVLLLPDGSKRAALGLWLEQLRDRFRGRILPFDEETALVWGALSVNAEQRGNRLPAIDSLIAAYAVRHTAVLATRNVSDFAAAGVDVVNPWDFDG